MKTLHLQLSPKECLSLYALYQENFPSDELRPCEKACLAFQRKNALHFCALQADDMENFHTYSRSEPKGDRIALGKSFVSAYLLHQNTLFIEYLVTPKAERGKKYAQKLLQDLQKNFNFLLVEIEIPCEEEKDTLLRLAFYEKLGFSCLSKNYFLPQMDKQKAPRPMWLFLWSKQAFLSFEEKESYEKHLREDLKNIVYYDML